MYFKNCRVFCVIGHGGIGNADKGGALYRTENCRDFVISNISDQINWGEDREYYDGSLSLNYKKFFPLSEKISGKTIIVPSNERPVIYKR